MRDYGDDWRRDGRQRQESRGGQHAWAPAPNPKPWPGNDDDAPWRTPPPHDPWGPQGSVPFERPARPIPRQTSAQTPPRDSRAVRRGEAESPRRTAPAPQSPAWRRSKLISPLILVALPLLGAVGSGPALGVAFSVACVAAALGAALLCTANGLWWIVPCTPIALLVVAFGWVAAEGLNNAKTTVAAATNVFQGVAGAFPGIAAGTAVALVVAGVRVGRGAAEARGRRA